MPASSRRRRTRTCSTEAKTLNASGVPAYSIGGADGWTLTDLFENIYIRTAGAESTTSSPRTRSRGRTSRSRTRWPRWRRSSATRTTRRRDRRAPSRPTSRPRWRTPLGRRRRPMVLEGDFVAGTSRSTKAEPETGFNVFTFPSINDSGTAPSSAAATWSSCSRTTLRRGVRRVPGDARGGRDLGQARRLLVAEQERRQDASTPTRFSGRPRARSPRRTTFRFDLSDLQPSAFGGTVGQGLFKLFQDFLKNPDDVDGIAQQMEAAAAKAFGESTRV